MPVHARVHGPYVHGRKFRIWVIGHDGSRSYQDCKTADEATRTILELEKALGIGEGVSAATALEEYEAYLKSKGNKESSIKVTMWRLRGMLGDWEIRPLKVLTAETAGKLYQGLTKKQKADSHRNTLAEAKTWGRWLVKVKHVRSNPFEGIEPVGRRSRGKKQLRHDEARRLLGHCMACWDGPAGDGSACPREAAAGVATGLLLGLRASEIVKRRARDLDSGGSVLWIPESKTRAGERVLRVPEVLREALMSLAAGKGPDEFLFGDHGSNGPRWLRQWTKRLCAEARVPIITTHGLRGTHATLALDAGLSGEAVARSLGHASETVTRGSYALPGAGDEVEQRKRMETLEGK